MTGNTASQPRVPLLSRMEEIRKRLEKATPGEWTIDRREAGTVLQVVGSGGFVIHEDDLGAIPTEVGAAQQERLAAELLGNVNLIAHAPSDIAYLLAELASTLQSAQAEEREACAKVAESYKGDGIIGAGIVYQGSGLSEGNGPRAPSAPAPPRSRQMNIKNCPNCGGTHYGSLRCPYILAPCVVCGDETILACSDCAIDSGGKQSIHVCKKDECRCAHESKRHPKSKEPEFSQYRRSQIAELRPYVPGEPMRAWARSISVSEEDKKAGSPKLGDMIARNPKNHADQWLVAAQYFADNFEPATKETP